MNGQGEWYVFLPPRTMRADRADNKPFSEIIQLTDIPEGTIVRVITRLDETCREVRDAARVIGDADLFTKMEEAQALIKRDSESFRGFESRVPS